MAERSGHGPPPQDNAADCQVIEIPTEEQIQSITRVVGEVTIDGKTAGVCSVYPCQIATGVHGPGYPQTSPQRAGQ